MQNFRPGGWSSSPEPPAEKHPATHRRAWLNTGRASSGHVGATGTLSLLPPSLSCVYSTHYLNSLYLGTFFFFVRLSMPLQSPWPHGYFFFISLRLSVSFEHTKTRRTMLSSHQRHCMYVWLGYFISPYFQQPERTKSFICNIVEDFFFFKDEVSCTLWDCVVKH